VSETGHDYGYRLSSIERRLDRIETLEPAVVKQQVADIKNDLRVVAEASEKRDGEMAEAVDAVRKILIGFLITFAVLAVGTVVTIMQITQSTP